MIQIFLANLLSLGRIEIELVKALVQELVAADHCLLQLREALGEAEIVDVGERTGWGCG